MIDDRFLARLREEMPVLSRQLFFNFASVSPPPRRVVAAVQSWLTAVSEHGLRDVASWDPMLARVRADCAALIGADPDEIALVRSTSHGLALVAEGLDWRPGDEVAVCRAVEYPSNVHPWYHLAARGVVVREIAPHNGGVVPGKVASALGPRTRLVAVSSVQFASGHVTDLAAVGALCRQAGALLCVDGIQSVGCVPVDVKAAGVHFLAADSHKWMLGLSGTGFLYVDAAVLDRLRPPLVGWKSMVNALDFDRLHDRLLPDARRFEEGSPCYAAVAGMGAAVEMLLEVGIEAISRAIADRLAILDEGLGALGCDVSPPAGERAGILTFVPPDGQAARLLDALSARGVSASLRRGRIRLAPHFVNTEEEMHRLVAMVGELVKLGARG